MKKLILGFMVLMGCMIFPEQTQAETPRQFLNELYTWTYTYEASTDGNEKFAFYRLQNKDFTHRNQDPATTYYHPDESIAKVYLQNSHSDDDLEGLKKTLFRIQQNIETAIVDNDATLDRICDQYFKNVPQQPGRKTIPDKDDCKRSISEFTKANAQEADYRTYEKAFVSIQYAREKLFPQLDQFRGRLADLLGEPHESLSVNNRDLTDIQGVDGPTPFDDTAGRLYIEVEDIRFKNLEQTLFPSWRGSGQVNLKMEQMIQRMSPSEKERLTFLQEQLMQVQKEYQEALDELARRQDEVRTVNARVQEAARAKDLFKERESNCNAAGSSADADTCKNLEAQAKDALVQEQLSTSDAQLSKSRLESAEAIYKKAEANLKDAQNKYDDFLTQWHNLNMLPQGVIGRNCDGNFLLDYMPVFTKILLYLIAPLVFIMFLYAGVRFIYSGDDDQDLAGAKKWFAYAVIGILLIILSYSIMKATYFVFSTSEEAYEAQKYECGQMQEWIDILEIDETQMPTVKSTSPSNTCNLPKASHVGTLSRRPDLSVLNEGQRLDFQLTYNTMIQEYERYKEIEEKRNTQIEKVEKMSPEDPTYAQECQTFQNLEKDRSEQEKKALEAEKKAQAEFDLIRSTGSR